MIDVGGTHPPTCFGVKRFGGLFGVPKPNLLCPEDRVVEPELQHPPEPLKMDTSPKGSIHNSQSRKKRRNSPKQ